MNNTDKQELLGGERVIGQFDVSGAEHDVPGVLSWQPDGGATLELIDDAPGFPREFDSEPLVVHGVLRGGEAVSMVDARLTAITNGLPARLKSATLAVGEHTEPNERWPRAIYSTAALTEWRNDTGIHFSYPARKKRAGHFRIEYRSPVVDEVPLRGAHLRFTGRIDTSGVGYRPDFWMRNRAVLIVDVTRPRTISDMRSAHGLPLLSLMSLAADRPDDLTQEVYYNPAAQRRIEVWRNGGTGAETEWRGRYLFAADAVQRYPQAIAKWWSLHRRVWPALGLFADHVREGPTYSPSRFLMAYSALEVYGRVARKTKNLRRLRDYAQVDSEVIGCTNRTLKLIDITRGYLAHFNNVTEAQRAEVEDHIYESTRRVAAFTQACLLRELGFTKGERERLLAAHYRTWPLM